MLIMKKLIKLQQISLILIISTMISFTSLGQDLAVQADYNPSHFTGYPMAGTLKITLVKSGATSIPANSFSITVALPPEVAWTLVAFTVPAGFTVDGGSTATEMLIRQTGEYTGDGLTSIKEFEIPVKATAPVAAGSTENYRVAIQQDALTYSDNNITNDASAARVTVASNALPVTLTKFDVIKEAQTSLLSWSTTEEFNSDHFNVEHSLNAKNWNSIGTVKSKGESKVLEKYSFTHEEPVEGENLYRLKMVDQDGSFAYSRIVSVTFGEGAGAQIYPNPASDYLLIKSAEWKSVSKLKIISLNGQNVFEAAGKTLTNQIDIRKIDPGVYLLEITRVNGQKDLKKFVVVH